MLTDDKPDPFNAISHWGPEFKQTSLQPLENIKVAKNNNGFFRKKGLKSALQILVFNKSRLHNVDP